MMRVFLIVLASTAGRHAARLAADSARGERLFESLSCIQRHSVNGRGHVAADLGRRIDRNFTPGTLASTMWNHAHLPSTREKRGVFETSVGTNGEAIFKSKRCFGCHSGYSSLADQITGRTLTEIAAAMWNHGSSMPAPPEPFVSGEMRELLSYLWARQFFEDAGDAGRGKGGFAAKHCATCHNDPSSGAPKLAGGQRSFTGVTFTGATMVSALWHHGPRMLEQMNNRGSRWPRFDGREMSDLIAYLNSGDRAK